MPETKRSRSGAESEAASNSLDIKIVPATGCFCGCQNGGDECKRHEPIPVPKGCGGCQALSSEQIAYCSRRRYFCSENSCAWASLNADLGRVS